VPLEVWVSAASPLVNSPRAKYLAYRCRANAAHTSQSIALTRAIFSGKVFKSIQVVPSLQMLKRTLAGVQAKEDKIKAKSKEMEREGAAAFLAALSEAESSVSFPLNPEP